MFFKRLFSTVILLTIFSCIIFGEKMFGTPWVSKIAFLVFGGFLSYFVPYETCNMLKQAEKPVLAKLTSASIFLTFVSYGIILLMEKMSCACVKYTAVEAVMYAVVLLLLLALPWILLLFIIGKEGGLQRILNSLGIIALFVPPFLVLEEMYFRDGVNVFLFFVIGTKIGDIGAYVFGTLSNKLMKGGNHKMIPSISPGKSWEGAAGGMLASIVFATSLFGWAFPVLSKNYGIWLPIVLGIILFIFGAAGDLAESCIKRVCGVKDSGKTLPGIGGVFDLVDSLLLNSIIFTVFMMFFK